LHRHHENLHKDKFGVLEGSLRENKLKNLKCDLQRQQNMFTVATKTTEAALQTSFIISQIVAKKSIPFMDGEYAKECIMKAAEILCPEKQQLFKNISLSANTVAERVNDLAGDIQCQLKENSKYFVAYSIAIDEGTDVKDIVQLAAFF
jgi:phosphopantetheinyl transferase (holo-ACP synthase)